MPICFFPKQICEVTTKLIITNPLTNDYFEYDLKGITEEPLAQEHIKIDCQARVTTKHEFSIQNTTDKVQTYTVETDLICATGNPTIQVMPKRRSVYSLAITPLMSG